MLPGGGGRAKQQRLHNKLSKSEGKGGGGRCGGAKNMINVQKNISCKTVKQIQLFLDQRHFTLDICATHVKEFFHMLNDII